MPNLYQILPNRYLAEIWELLQKSEICVASDYFRVANVSTEHLKQFKPKFGHGVNFCLRAGPRPVHQPLICQQCIRSDPSSHPTILAPAMTPISPAQCPILYCNFRVIMHQVRTSLSQSLPRKHSMSRTGNRTALISTRPLRLPSACSFPQSVQLKPGKLQFLNWIFDGVECFIIFPFNPRARFECQ